MLRDGPLKGFAAGVFGGVVWRFLRNGDVMRVTLPYTGW